MHNAHTGIVKVSQQDKVHKNCNQTLILKNTLITNVKKKKKMMCYLIH